MKTINQLIQLKPIAAIFLFGALLSSCNDSKKEETATTTATDSTVAHTHNYICPMHPEEKSDKPAKCSKCGMDLEHNDGAGAGNDKKYEMKFTSSPAEIESGKPAKLSFRPTEEDNAEVLVPLDVVHEKKIHLLIMSKDLSYFAHEHPEYTANGDYIWDHTFPGGGEYVMFQDYNPSGAGHRLGRQDFTVKGKALPVTKLPAQDLDWEENGYKATLASATPFAVDSLIELKANISKDGKPVTDLENYLGALAHMVVVSEDTKEYLHVHPMDSETKGPEITLHTCFPKPGKYKVFMQFAHAGKINTSSFIVDVK